MNGKPIVILLLIVATAGRGQQFETRTYPRRDVKPAEVLTQKTLERSMDYLFSWQQAASAFGHLTLHSCWAIDGVIGRKYHGQYTSANYHYIRFMLAMYEETDDTVWKRRAEDVISNIMFLQAESGG